MALDALFHPHPMIDREIVELLHQSARPADGSIHRTFGLPEAEEYIFAVLRKKSRSGLQHFVWRFHGDGRADGVGIAFDAAQTKGDGRRQIFCNILQQAQLRSVAVLEKHLLAAVMIEVGQGERAAVLQEIEIHRAGNIGKCSIAIVGVKDVALVAAPGVVGADQLVDGVPSLFVIRATAWLSSGELATTCRQKKLFRSSRIGPETIPLAMYRSGKPS